MSGEIMSGFVSAMVGTNGFTATNVWGQLTELAPLIVSALTISVGVYFARKLIKGEGKAKVRI